MSHAAATGAWAAVAACLAGAPALAGDGPSFAIRAGRIMPVSTDHPAVIEDGIIVVRDGRIVAIGADVDVPAGIDLVEMPDATITPGFVAASTSIAGNRGGDISIGAGYRAVDSFDHYADQRETLAAGVTTVHLNPGWHRLLSGQGAVVRLGGEGPDRILLDEADLTITLGPSVVLPPNMIEYTVPPSPDQAIKPAMPQRPGSRMTQFLALKEALEAAGAEGADWSSHALALNEAWAGGRPVRVQAQQAVDLTGALNFMRTAGRTGYLVGGADAVDVADQIASSGVPLVYTVDATFRRPGADIGENPAANERFIRDLAAFGDVEHLAIALPNGRPAGDLRMAAALAGRSGLSAERRLAAITRIPAEILGVDDEVGSLAVGRRADMLVMTGDPLATQTHVQRVYVDGRVAYSRATSDALVVRAGTIWLGEDGYLEGGEVLIEDGRITEVGRRVGRPPHARVMDAGPDGFVTPGLIDAYGHLGLRGDRGTLAPNLTLTRLIGVPDLPEMRVARSGITSVLLAPYGVNNAGGQVSAIKTAGHSRTHRIIRDTAAVSFAVGGDPRGIPGQLRGRLEQGKKYAETWKKYEADLAEWKKKAAEGKTTVAKPTIVEETSEGEKADPVTGTWAATLSGGPLPEEQTGRVVFKLNGTSIEGRIIEPEVPEDVRITGELDGKKMSGEIELDTGGMGTPTWQGELVEEDLIRGTAGLAGMVTVDFEMRRTDKASVEFKVTRSRRTTGADGRPLPPKVDEALEPIRALLEKRIPAIVDVTDHQAITAVLDVLVGQYELPVILRNAGEAARVAERLHESEIGVVLPTNVIRREDGMPYHQGLDLSRRGVSVAFQSAAGDGARTLRDVAIYAVERGLSPDVALRAMTVDAARMYHLEDRLGSIAAGRDGDLVIFSGHPLDAETSVERVIIGGEEIRP
ncbi:MAG: amidohydrolase family protein [Phycisphaerales bacterium]